MDNNISNAYTTEKIEKLDNNSFSDAIDASSYEMVATAIMKCGYDPDNFDSTIDSVGRVYVVNKKTNRKTVVGLFKNGKVLITKPARTARDSTERKCINLYVTPSEYQEIVESSILEGLSISAFVRNAIKEHMDKK